MEPQVSLTLKKWTYQLQLLANSLPDLNPYGTISNYQNGDITKKLDEVYTKEQLTMEPEMVAIQIASIGKEKCEN